jgi:hypothetical protein
MCAAALEKLDRFLLIVDRVEFGFDGFWFGRDLTERKRRRKHLYKDCIHRLKASAFELRNAVGNGRSRTASTTIVPWNL